MWHGPQWHVQKTSCFRMTQPGIQRTELCPTWTHRWHGFGSGQAQPHREAHGKLHGHQPQEQPASPQPHLPPRALTKGAGPSKAQDQGSSSSSTGRQTLPPIPHPHPYTHTLGLLRAGIALESQDFGGCGCSSRRGPSPFPGTRTIWKHPQGPAPLINSASS